MIFVLGAKEVFDAIYDSYGNVYSVNWSIGYHFMNNLTYSAFYLFLTYFIKLASENKTIIRLPKWIYKETVFIFKQRSYETDNKVLNWLKIHYVVLWTEKTLTLSNLNLILFVVHVRAVLYSISAFIELTYIGETLHNYNKGLHSGSFSVSYTLATIGAISLYALLYWIKSKNEIYKWI